MSLLLYREDLSIDRPPTIGLDAVDAAGSVGSRDHVIEVCPRHARAARSRPVKLGGGVVQTLVGQLLTAQSCSNSRRKMDVAFVRLIHL